MTGPVAAPHTTVQTCRLTARPVLAPRPQIPPGATNQRRSLNDEGTSCAPTSIATVLTVAVSDTDSMACDVCPENTSIRMGDAGALGLTIGDRALVKLAVLLNDAANALNAVRNAADIKTRSGGAAGDPSLRGNPRGGSLNAEQPVTLCQ